MNHSFLQMGAITELVAEIFLKQGQVGRRCLAKGIGRHGRVRVRGNLRGCHPSCRGNTILQPLKNGNGSPGPTRSLRPFSLPAAGRSSAHIFPCQKNDLRLRLPPPKRRRSQVVRQWSAKPLFSGSNPLAASSENQKGSAIFG